MNHRGLPAELGEIIGAYRLDELIHRGAFASVYKASHVALGRVACVKVLAPTQADAVDFTAGFLNDARIVNELGHENVVDIFEFVQTDAPTRVAAVMEYIHGRTLGSVLMQRPLTEIQALNVMLQLIDAMRAVHARGIVHRHLEPSHLMVVAPLKSDFSVQPSVKILSFGSGPSGDTDPYLAPEQLDGSSRAQALPATDVFALGALLYEMVTGRRVFTGTAAEIAHAKTSSKPVLTSARGPLQSIITRCLAVRPEERPSLAELEGALIEAAKSSPPDPVESESVRTGPSRIGEYQCFIELPPRRMAQLFVARKDGQDQVCILKRLLQHLESNPTALARFRREVRIAQHLSHPRLVGMLDASIEDGTMVIATEFVVGQPLDLVLAHLLERVERMPLPVLAAIARGVLEGLQYAHTAKDLSERPLELVHRDLTPNAIMVAFDGGVKIRDFGIARAVVDDFKTAPGTAVGSIEYMSPEQVRSQPIDQRSDLYTFAAVLYEVLAGVPVVRRSTNVLELLKSVINDHPTPLRQLRPDLSSTLIDVIERGLDKDPAKRWPTAASFQGALEVGWGCSPATEAELGSFLRALMPDAEREAISILNKYAPVATTPEDHEPSVLTMPGAPVLFERSVRTEAPRQKQRSLLAPVLAVAGAVGVLYLVSRLFTPAPAQDPIPPQPEVVALAPQIEVHEVDSDPDPPTALEPPAEVVSPPSPPPPRFASKPSPTPPKVPASTSPEPFTDLRSQLARLRSTPKDIKSFDRLLAAIAERARDLPATSQRRVKVDLDAAERTYDVEQLSSALNKLILESARHR